MSLISDTSETQNLEQETVSDESVESVVNLGAILTIQNVADLHENLKKSFIVLDVIEINASQVASIDTATLQLLVALKKEAINQQKSIVVTEPSQRFLESVALLGLQDVLEMESFV